MRKIFQKVLEDRDFSELLKGGGISFILRFGGLTVGYLLTLVIANLFGAKGLGDYVLAIAVLRLFTLLAKLGLDTTSIRFIASFASQDKWTSIFKFRKQVVSILSISSVVGSVLMYFLSVPISQLINANPLYIQINAFFVLPMIFFMLHYQSLRGLKRIAEFSFFYRMAQALFSLISIVILYQFFATSDIPVYAYLISVFIVSVLSFISFRYWLNKRSKGIDSAELEIMSYSDLFKISIPLMFAQSVQFIMAWTDKLMLGNMMGSEEVGIYFTVFKLSMFASLALMAINSIASPKFAELFGKKDFDGLKKVAHQSSKMIFLATLPLVLFFFAFPDFLLGLFGEEFKVGVKAFVFLSLGKLISSFSGSVGSLLQMTGKQVIFMSVLFVGAIVNVLLNFFLIPKFGINGAALASMISLSVWNLIMVYFVKREFGFYTFYIPFLKR